MTEKTILIRTGCSPFENLSEKEVSDNNLFGNNVGNLLYAYSIFRWLMTDENTVLVPDRYRPERGLCSDEEIDRINQTCSMYIVPMADTFRISFEKNLRQYTEFIRKLKIPVILIGVGISNRIDDENVPSMVPDEVAKAFMNAVLDHSSIVGLRGGRTLALLTKLGYREEIDVTPIGCPSLYTFGTRLSVTEPSLEKGKTLILTNNIFADPRVHRFIRRTAAQYPDHLYIPQRIEEMRMYYNGKDMDLKLLPGDRDAYPVSLKDPFFQEGRTCFPMNIRTWLELTKDAGLAVGPRLHGSVAAMLSGVPALMIRKDWRTKEIGEYHHFAAVDSSAITEQTRLEDLLQGLDFHGPEKVQKANCIHYQDFLRRNQVPNIYDTAPGDAGGVRRRSGVPFDRKIRQAKLMAPFLPYTQISRPQQAARNMTRLWNASPLSSAWRHTREEAGRSQ